MITTMMNQKRCGKLPDNGDPWAPNNLLTPEQKKNTGGPDRVDLRKSIDLFLYCYERDFMDSLNHDNQADVIEAFNSTSRYLE